METVVPSADAAQAGNLGRMRFAIFKNQFYNYPELFTSL
jgi:hypothetical protein